MSSRSLAAARAKRAGENAPPVSGNRPGTSIGSHAAFVPQQPPNVRLSRQQQPQMQMQQQMQQPQIQMQQTQQYNQQSQMQQTQNTLPFSKLSISDAIGLITLRLGRIEQWVIENENDNDNDNDNEHGKNQNNTMSENSNSIDNSILTSIINRLDSIEKKENGTVNDESISNLLEEVNKLSQQITKSDNEISKYNLIINKHTEQLFKFERELVETKDMLKTFMMKYDVFTQETNDKFADYECAISELEKNIQSSGDIINENVIDNDNLSQIEDTENNENNDNFIMSVDLKKIIKEELSGEPN